MFMRPTALLVLLSFAAMAHGEEVKRLVFSDLSPGSRFEFAAGDHVYRGEMVDPTTGEARLAASSDGARFTGPRTVFLMGATQGPQKDAGGLMLVKMNQVQTGMRLELGFGSLDNEHRKVTEPISAIRVE